MHLSRRLVFGPLQRIGAKANEISTAERDNLERTFAERTAELNTVNKGLTTALADVKTLSGLIPICAACKRIRDNKGYWQQIDPENFS